MAQHVRGVHATRSDLGREHPGIHPVVRAYVETYRVTHKGVAPGGKRMLRELAESCGLAPAVVKQSWRALKRELATQQEER